ncbi:Kanadaptin [Halocaridina rubra]|uniref:Kanadaptin n=1 Tax=Halocaridina rubra TaxID=373956 RepID=A0AAN8XJB0_HALRR
MSSFAESHEKKQKDWAKNDYYDSDEDDFLDRTGDVQRKRLRRMKTVGGKDSVVDTYDTLISKYNDVVEELSSLEKKLHEAERLKEVIKGEDGDDDDLDSYMRNLKSQVPDKHKRVNWKLRSVELRKEEMRLRKLANITKPYDRPELQPYISKYDTKQMNSDKSPFQRPSVSSKEEIKEPKTHGFKVHKIFEEEEPEKKLKLRRLDEEGYEIKPVKYSIPKVKAKPNVPTPYPQRKEIKEFLSMTSCIENFKQTERIESNMGKGETAHEISSNSKATQSDAKEVNRSERKRSGDSDANDAKEPSSEKRPRILGPTLPPTLECLRAGQQEPAKAKKKPVKKTSDFNADTAAYETWTPPANQTGDGRTSLNDKYGY